MKKMILVVVVALSASSVFAKSEHMRDSKQANHVSDSSYVGVKANAAINDTSLVGARAASEHMKDSKQADHVSDSTYVGVKGSANARQTYSREKVILNRIGN